MSGRGLRHHGRPTHTRPRSRTSHRPGGRQARHEAVGRTTKLACAVGRPFVLTESQKAEIARAVDEAELDNAFCEFVSTWGLAQYIVAPAALLIGLVLAVGRKRLVGIRLTAAAAMVLSGGCIGMMLYRGYFSSLGW